MIINMVGLQDYVLNKSGDASDMPFSNGHIHFCKSSFLVFFVSGHLHFWSFSILVVCLIFLVRSSSIFGEVVFIFLLDLDRGGLVTNCWCKLHYKAH